MSGVDGRGEQAIKVGQIWRRRSDGVLVRITGYKYDFDDARYQRCDNGRRGPIYGSYLRARYDLDVEAAR